MPESKTVLIAEDERVLRTLIRAALGDTELRIIEASNGTDALARAQEELPDILLLDVRMSGLDGYAVCRALKADPRTAGIKVVMLTARAQLRDRDRGIEAGADAYITKPFSPSDLRSSVLQLLG